MTTKIIDLDRNLFALAFSVTRCNWLPCGVATLLLLASDVGDGYLDAPLAFAVLRALILMIVGYSAYRMLLTDGRVTGLRAAATDEGRIPWRFVGVRLIIFAPILILGIVWTAPGTGVGPSSLYEIVLGVAMVFVYAALYILLGTALPEVADTGDASLGAAFERGRTNYLAIGRRMVFGPWLFGAATVAAMIGLVFMRVTTDLFSVDAGVFQPAALGPMLLFKASHVFAEVLTAIVLVRAYRRYPVAPRDAVAA